MQKTDLYEQGQPVLPVTKLVADLETPVSAYLKLSNSGSNAAFLLELVEGGAARGRYSMIGLNPDVIFRVIGDKAEINRNALKDKNNFTPCSSPPLAALRELISQSAIAHSLSLPPMSAGVFGYLGYDMVRQMERLPPAKPDMIGAPDALLVRPTIMVIFDTVRDELSVVTPVWREDQLDAKSAYTAANKRLDDIVTALDLPLKTTDHAQQELFTTQEPVSNTQTDRFLAMVERAKEYIRAGDIFQVVLSQRFTAPFLLSCIRPLPRFTPGKSSAFSVLPGLY